MINPRCIVHNIDLTSTPISKWKCKTNIGDIIINKQDKSINIYNGTRLVKYDSIKGIPNLKILAITTVSIKFWSGVNHYLYNGTRICADLSNSYLDIMSNHECFETEIDSQSIIISTFVCLNNMSTEERYCIFYITKEYIIDTMYNMFRNHISSGINTYHYVDLNNLDDSIMKYTLKHNISVENMLIIK